MKSNPFHFQLKQSLVGFAALSLLIPMASHSADVAKGKWVFDGFTRSTRDGQGSTCVGAAGPTHAFDAPNCNSMESQAAAAKQAENAVKRAAREKAEAERAAAMKEAADYMPGGQKDFRVRNSTTSKLLDGFGRDCVRDGSRMSASGGDCNNPAPQPSRADESMMAARRAADAKARQMAQKPAMPMVPGGALQPGQAGAYVQPTTTSAVLKDGYGRTCVKDGRWHPAYATESCEPALFSEWRSKNPPEVKTQAAAAPKAPDAPAPAPAPVAAAPDPNGPAQPDPGPGIAPAAEKVVAAPAPVIDNALPVFPVTTYAAEADDGASLLAADDDANPSLLDDDEDDTPAAAQADDADDDGPVLAADDDAPALAADDDATDDAVAAIPSDDEDEVAALDAPADPEDGNDDDPMPVLAEDMRDEDAELLAQAGDVDDLDDDTTALLVDDDAPDAGIPDGTAVAVADEDEPAAADEPEADDQTAYLGDGDLDDGIPDGTAVAVADEDEPAAEAEAAPDDQTAYLGDGELDDGIPDGEAVAIADEDEPAAADEPEADDQTAYLGDTDLPGDDVAEAAPMMALTDDDDDGPVAADDDADDDDNDTVADAAPAEETPAQIIIAATTADPNGPKQWDNEPGVAPKEAPKKEAAPVVDNSAAQFPVTRYEPEGTQVAAAEPAKAAPAPAAAAECPPTTIQMEEAQFDFDRAELPSPVVAKLNTIADQLKSSKCEAIQITGHTDRLGSAKYNQRLSERRAEAAKNYLVRNKGIDAGLISIVGAGENDLVTGDSCTGKRKKALITCYAPDRRVVITAVVRKP